MKQTFKKKKNLLTSSTLSNILNSKITATQPFVLMPHRGQKRILSCFSSSLSHQHPNGCVVNPEEEKKYEIFLVCHFLLFPFTPYSSRRIKESHPSPFSTHVARKHYITPTLQEILLLRAVLLRSPSLQFHFSCHYKF